MTQLALKLEQSRNLRRVSGSIAPHVIDFLRTRLVNAPEFHGSELAEYVSAMTKGMSAPGSADRIMRDLKRRKLVDVQLISRSGSKYRVRWVG